MKRNWVGLVIPVVLGIVAGALNFLAVQSALPPIKVVAAAEDIKASTVLSKDHLTSVVVRGSPAQLRSLVRWEDHGLLLERRINRSVGKDELILFADARESGGDVSLHMREDEVTLTLPPVRVVPGVRVEDQVHVRLVREGAGLPTARPEALALPIPRFVGPFRVVGFEERPNPFTGSRDEVRQLAVALKLDANKQPVDQDGHDLQAAVLKTSNERVAAVEFYRPRQ